MAVGPRLRNGISMENSDTNDYGNLLLHRIKDRFVGIDESIFHSNIHKTEDDRFTNYIHPALIW